jgi:hypothetical protein
MRVDLINSPLSCDIARAVSIAGFIMDGLSPICHKLADPLAGRLGYPMFSSFVIVLLPRFRKDIAVYWRAIEEAGHPRMGEEVALLFPLYMAETETEARTFPRESIMHYFTVLGRRMAAGDAPPPQLRDPAPHRRRHSWFASITVGTTICLMRRIP